MSNYLEYNDQMAFHPGYYIKELVDQSGLTQEDFAKRLDTTPKNLSLLIRGEQSMSIDMAVKLSRMEGTSINYWLNIQKTFDSLLAKFKSDQELEAEREAFRHLDYSYFQKEYGLPSLSGKTDEQIEKLRRFLKVSSLSALRKREMSVVFRASTGELSDAEMIRANAMVEIAVNRTLMVEGLRYDRKTFLKQVEYAKTLTTDHENFFPELRAALYTAGVIFIILPHMPGATINGASKRVGRSVMLMVSDRRTYADSFWFTMFHEMGHILHGDFGISFENETGEIEEEADHFAREQLIPEKEYQQFISQGQYDKVSILSFSNTIDRDPGLVVGRLQNDGKISRQSFNNLRHRYKVSINSYKKED